jgi:transmembrane sensor
MDDNYHDITVKQLSGKASTSEQDALLKWRLASPENETAYLEQKRIWQLTAIAPPSEVDTDGAWLKVKSKLHQEPETKVIPLYRSIWRVAASIILLIGMALLAKYYLFPYAGMEVVDAGNGQITVMLPDSSRVWLNKGSKLVYNKEFDGEARNVELIGEAFFEVHHDPGRPFTISTDKALTQVLGTSFNLRAYPTEPTVELTVATGKVSFRFKNKDEGVILTKGFAATLNTQKNDIKKTEATEENAWAWKTGKLKFQDKPLREVLVDLERYYGVTFDFAKNTLGACRFTGTFKQADLQEVLQVLETTMQLDFIRQNNQTYSLSGQGCN